ncbi:uncharacterized protein [Bemisia tabaci]|uniref:uncharacterized protein n=1 Tax=Bemisia tabaci TaxID=7038 RepID=UPI003B283FF3
MMKGEKKALKNTRTVMTFLYLLIQSIILIIVIITTEQSNFICALPCMSWTDQPFGQSLGSDSGPQENCQAPVITKEKSVDEFTGEVNSLVELRKMAGRRWRIR